MNPARKPPDYQPSRLPRQLGSGIVHLGLGAFHRAHQAVFTEEAIALCGGNWGIEAVSMRNRHLADVLNRQDGRYTVVERYPDRDRLQEIGCLKAAHVLQANPERVTERLSDPAISIVTLTVTEKGYCADLSKRRLDETHPQIVADLKRPAQPHSAVGAIVAGLAKRKARNAAGLSLISCDNLTENGALLKSLVLRYATMVDETLTDWIATNCTFPNCMVDRITPAPTQSTFDLVRRTLGQEDAAAVETEPFKQWVIEDRFAGPRPAWELAGVELVEDVRPYETMKLRVLNGAHSLLAYVGCLGNFEHVRDVMGVPDLSQLVEMHMQAAALTLSERLVDTIEPYIGALMARFENPAIEHRCSQIAMDGSQKLPQRILAPAREALAKSQKIDTFALAIAAWIKFIQMHVRTGARSPLQDPLSMDLIQAVHDGSTSPLDQIQAIAAIKGFDHHGVLEIPSFQRSVSCWMNRLDEAGVEAAVGRWTEMTR